MKSLNRQIVWLPLALPLLHCGQVQKDSQSSERNNREKVEVQLFLSSKDDGSASLFETSLTSHFGWGSFKDGLGLSSEPQFNLLPATSVSFAISDCKSGYSATGLTAASDSKTVNLYKYDRDCVAGLESFGFGGSTYVPVSGIPLKGAPLETANYHVSADPTKVLRVKVLTQFDAQLSTSGSSASFVFEQISKGSDYSVVDYTYAHTATAGGLEAPNVTINSAIITDIDVSGKATFEVTFECSAAMTTVGADPNCPAALSSGDALIKKMSALLATSPAPGANPVVSLATAESEFTTRSAGVVNLTNASFVSGNNFKVTVQQQSAAALYNDRDLVLYLRITDPLVAGVYSYKYFRFAVGVPSN